MAQLSRHAGHAVPDVAAHNDASAYARAECDDAHIIHVTSCTQPVLAQGSRIRIIFQDDGRLESALNFFFNRIIMPIGKVRRLAQHTRPLVDNTGHADTDAA